MSLKFKFKSKDEIPAEQAALYVERDGAWVLDVDGADDLYQYRNGDGERFTMSVADRSQPMLIEQFARWGIQPLTAHEKPIKAVTGRGEVAGGEEGEAGGHRQRSRYLPHPSRTSVPRCLRHHRPANPRDSRQIWRAHERRAGSPARGARARGRDR